MEEYLIKYFEDKLSNFESLVNVEISTSLSGRITINLSFKKEQYLLENLIYPGFVEQVCNELKHEYAISPYYVDFNINIVLLDFDLTTK